MITFYSYGTTNQAFDPTPETDDPNHGQIHTISVPIGVMADSDRSSFDSLEEEGSITPRAEEYVTREGKSFFYGDPNPENDEVFAPEKNDTETSSG